MTDEDTLARDHESNSKRPLTEADGSGDSPAPAGATCPLWEPSPAEASCKDLLVTDEGISQQARSFTTQA
jgi:hypothetical protein